VSWHSIIAVALLMATASPLALANAGSFVLNSQLNLTSAGTHNPNGARGTLNDIVFNTADVRPLWRHADH